MSLDDNRRGDAKNTRGQTRPYESVEKPDQVTPEGLYDATETGIPLHEPICELDARGQCSSPSLPPLLPIFSL